MKKRQHQNQSSRPVGGDLVCADKLGFDTQKQANAAKIVADLQHGTKLITYRCRNCGLWHMASSN